MQLKVHSCSWSGDYPANSLPAIQECYREGVARAEIDLNLLADADFLATHDAVLDDATTGTGRVDAITRRQAERLRFRDGQGGTTEHRPPLLSEVVAALQAAPDAPTLLELDLKDVPPWPWPRVEELARLVEPVRERVVFNSGADWNLRRLRQVDPGAPLGFDPLFYLAWAPPDEPADPLPGVLGAYGYLDAHPLARERQGPAADYLGDRLGGILRLVPGAREVHLSLRLFERMLEDGFDGVAFCHQLGLAVDLWTLDAGTPGWEARLQRAVAAGADVVTTNTPRALAGARATP